MDKDLWEELEAQVESHGPEAVDLVVVDGKDNIIFIVTDVKYVDGRVVVIIE